MKTKFCKGIIATWVLTFAVSMLIMLGGIVSFVLLQQRVSVERMASEESLHIAEAGINYYKWYIYFFFHLPAPEQRISAVILVCSVFDSFCLVI